MFKLVVAIVVAVSLIGCTSMRGVAPSRPQEIQRNIELGDTVSIVTLTGAQYEFEVTAISATGVSGMVSGRGATFPFAQIKSIKVQKFSAGKTVGLVGGVVGAVSAVVFVGALLLLSAFRRS